MPRGMMTTYGVTKHGSDAKLIEPVKPPAAGRVIEPPVLEEGVELINIIEAEHGAKQGIVRSLNSVRTYMRKLEQARLDAGTWCATRGVANPVSALGGSHLSSVEVDELQKVFDRYVSAIRKGVPTTLEGLGRPLS